MEHPPKEAVSTNEFSSLMQLGKPSLPGSLKIIFFDSIGGEKFDFNYFVNVSLLKMT